MIKSTNDHHKCELTLARFPSFATFASGRGGGGATPAGVSKLSIIELSEKSQRRLRHETMILIPWLTTGSLSLKFIINNHA